MSAKRVRLVALDQFDNELGAIDGEQLTIWTTEDNEIQVSNGFIGLSGPVIFGWEDLAPDGERGGHVHLELEIVDMEE